MALALDDIDRNPDSDTWFPTVIEVEVIGRYQLRLTFDDGLVRELDLTEDTSLGGVFEPLKDPNYFARVRVDHEAGTIVWPNEVDYCPTILHGDAEPYPGPPPHLIREYVNEAARHFKHNRPLLWEIVLRFKSWSWAVRWRLRERRERRTA